MKKRILPQAEWPKLKGTEAELLWPHLNPENSEIIVIEDGDRIVATWTLMRMVHAECIWVDPEYKGSPGVWRGLITLAREIATKWGVSKLITGSITQEVTDLIVKWGGFPVPCATYVLPVWGRSRRRDRELGRAFHVQLSGQIEDGNHPDDPVHNEHVGKALRTAIEGREPVRAMDEYNAWAIRSGYEPIQYLGSFGGRMRADIVTAVIEVDDQYVVHVVKESQPCP